jgi:hypothetical protein
MEIGIHSHTYVAGTGEDVISDYYPEYSRHMNKTTKKKLGRSGILPNQSLKPA